MSTVSVQLGPRSYDIHVGRGLLDSLGSTLSKLTGGRYALVVTDESVVPHYGERARKSLMEAGFQTDQAVMPPGESTKSLAHLSSLFDLLVDRHADRRSVVVALGGGVIGDLAGFAAATYARGIPFFQVPTTLLSMVDSSVGGKVAVDHPRAKNMIGAFHQPLGVIADTELLETLPERQYRCGLAEVVKYGVIMDAEFFKFLERSAEAINRHEAETVSKIVAHSCRLKADVVEEDEFETTGRRAILNYGHTFAHAFETSSDYEELQHGEAVAIGMICAAHLAEKLGRIDDSLNRRQRSLWKKMGLPTVVPKQLLDVDLISVMRRDKKSQGGKLRFVLPSRLGHVDLVDNIDEDLVRQVIRETAGTV